MKMGLGIIGRCNQMKKKKPEFDPNKTYRVWYVVPPPVCHKSKEMKGDKVEEALMKLGAKKIVHWVELVR